METIDLKGQLKSVYGAKAGKPVIVEVPAQQYLMADGCGDPNGSPQFEAAVTAMYGVAYGVKFGMRKGKGIDFPVMPLEGIWWVDDDAKFSPECREHWHWTLMIMLPGMVTEKEVGAAVDAAAMKWKGATPFPPIRLEHFDEGRVAQVLHVGPYQDEQPTIELLHRFIQDQGLRLRGRHHEIYLGDPRRSAPEKLKTILRQPVR